MYKVYAYTCAQRTCAILHNYQGATRQSVIFVQIKSNAETHVYYKCVCIYASYIYAILFVFISIGIHQEIIQQRAIFVQINRIHICVL